MSNAVAVVTVRVAAVRRQQTGLMPRRSTTRGETNMQPENATVKLGEYWINVAFEFWTAVSYPALYFARLL